MLIIEKLLNPVYNLNIIQTKFSRLISDGCIELDPIHIIN